AGHGTFNSRSMPVGGSGVHVCAGRIVEKAKKIAAEMMEVAAEDLAYEGGSFVVPGTGVALAFAKVARMAYVGHVLPKGIEPGLDETLFYDPTGMGAPSGVHIAYVEVDPDTIPGDAFPNEPVGGEGNRRKRRDRRTADNCARRTRRIGAVRHRASRY